MADRIEIEKLRKRERRVFRRRLEIGAGPLGKRLHKLFQKIARREIRELRDTGQLDSLQPKEKIKKVLTPVELEEMQKILRSYGVRRAKSSAKHAGKLVGNPEFIISPEKTEAFFAMKGPMVTGFGTRVSTQIAKQTRQIMLEITRDGGATVREASRRLFNRVTLPGGALSPQRALSIARTEMAAIDNFARTDAFAVAGIEKIEWLTITDGNERDDHHDMDGVKTPINEPFEMPDGSLMMHPGDESLGAGPEQIVNCRCTTVPVRS